MKKIYGVTPWRKRYAEEVFHIPKEKTDVLMMGADDDSIQFEIKDQIRKKIRKKHQIGNHDYLSVSGGRLSEN